jgi:predicted DNA-binding transcriptional regulator YafY
LTSVEETPVVALLKEFSEYVLEKASQYNIRYRVKDIFDAILEAGIKKRKCLLRYKKKEGEQEYYIAPYSLKWKGDSEFLFAYDFLDGHIKSFNMDRITGVFISHMRFVPKWEVELG